MNRNRCILGVVMTAALAGCGSRPAPVPVTVAPTTPAGFGQTPPFSRLSYAPFARADAVAIALREWRLWGMAVDDDPPGTRPPQTTDQDKPERFPGLWERVGEYWWTSQDSGTHFAAWTGKHDENGQVFLPTQDGHYAWSAAFISYVMRIAGAGNRFPYSAAHADYINAAREVSLGQANGIAVSAERPDAYAPQPGDLICLGRGASGSLTFDNLPTGSFPGHCDIVVAAQQGLLTVIGGNVDDTVTEKHIPTTPSGMLLDPTTGVVVDTRYPWFVVLRVLYDQ
ncbi:MAG: DUF2272 domain-containing protein [Acetobacteraceae bacterium]